jgi:hypothetical protein
VGDLRRAIKGSKRERYSAPSDHENIAGFSELPRAFLGLSYARRDVVSQLSAEAGKHVAAALG